MCLPREARTSSPKQSAPSCLFGSSPEEDFREGGTDVGSFPPQLAGLHGERERQGFGSPDIGVVGFNSCELSFSRPVKGQCRIEADSYEVTFHSTLSSAPGKTKPAPAKLDVLWLSLNSLPRDRISTAISSHREEGPCLVCFLSSSWLQADGTWGHHCDWVGSSWVAA